jgi:hypothetical protein
MNGDVTLTLTDSEWMSLIDGSDEREGNLGRCCANISALRDSIIGAARDGGLVHAFTIERFKMHLGWVIDGHDIADIPALMKVCEQLGIEPVQPHAPDSLPESL